ncbi:MAG: sigma-70 family RNA polymerase sigma factor [Actinomycetia bacterium]|nr:sigma-70 family RNA polymerase sigma factor [Actinomycetes bacterium]
MREVRATRPQGGLADEFVAQRQRLRGIAWRVLGSYADADDAVQETWLRLQRADADAIDNLAAWLTTVVSRVCVDQLRSRGARHEDVDAPLPETPVSDEPDDPEATALRAEEIGSALLVVLDTLGPLERLALILHDAFGLSFDDIAPIVERTPSTTRQLASRARRRIRGVDVPAEHARRRAAVEALLKASSTGDFGALLQLLDPEVELRADDAVVDNVGPYAEHGAPLLRSRVRGADAVARVFAGRAEQARAALVDGLPGAVYARDGVVAAAYAIYLDRGRIVRIEVIGDTDRLADLTIG